MWCQKTLHALKHVNLRVGSIPLSVDGGQVPALLDGQVEAAGVDGVHHPELYLAPDGHGAVSTAFLWVDAQHGLRTRLKNSNNI